MVCFKSSKNGLFDASFNTIISTTPVPSLTLTSTISSSGAGCPDGWESYEDKCYHFSLDTEAMPAAQV